MTLDVTGVLRDAWTMAKRDAQILAGVAGLFLLVPAIAQAMFVTMPPTLPSTGADQAAIQAWLDAVTAWSRINDLPIFAIAIASLFGTLTLFVLYTDRTRPDVAGALRLGLGLLLRYIFLSLLVTMPVNIGVLLWILPGLYLKGRLMLVGPIFVADRPVKALAVWRRSFALTRRHQWKMMALAAIPLLAGDLLALPFDLIGHALDGAPMANPAVAALLDILSGTARTTGVLASILVEIALYRRLSSGT